MDRQLCSMRFSPYSKPSQTRRAPIEFGNPFKHIIMILNHVRLTKERNNTLGVSNAYEGIIQALVPISGIHVFTTPCYNGDHCTHGAKCTHAHTEYPTGSHLVTDENLMQLIDNTIWYTKLNYVQNDDAFKRLVSALEKQNDDAFKRLVSALENLKVLLYPPADAPVTRAIDTMSVVGAPVTRAIGTMSVVGAPVFPPTLPKLTDDDLERVRNRVVTCSAERE